MTRERRTGRGSRDRGSPARRLPRVRATGASAGCQSGSAGGASRPLTTRPAAATPTRPVGAAASLAVSAGANVKAVQRMLGHASAAMTLDRYADLFDDDLDAADRLDAVARAAGVYPMCTGADVVRLPTITEAAAGQ